MNRRTRRLVSSSKDAQLLGALLAARLADELNLASAPSSWPTPPHPAQPPASPSFPSNPDLDYPMAPSTLATSTGSARSGCCATCSSYSGPDQRFPGCGGGTVAAIYRIGFRLFPLGHHLVREERQDPGHRVLHKQEDHDHARGVALREPRIVPTAGLRPHRVPAGWCRAASPRVAGDLRPAHRRGGVPRSVFAWREPRLFTDGEGAEQLQAAARHRHRSARARRPGQGGQRPPTDPARDRLGSRQSRSRSSSTFSSSVRHGDLGRRLPAIKASLHRARRRLGVALSRCRRAACRRWH